MPRASTPDTAEMTWAQSLYIDWCAGFKCSLSPAVGLFTWCTPVPLAPPGGWYPWAEGENSLRCRWDCPLLRLVQTFYKLPTTIMGRIRVQS